MEMNEAVEQCELPSFQPNSIAGDDLGLTLSPGSQSQLPDPWLQDENPLDIGIDIDLDFDPFTDFDQLVSQLDDPNKRALDELFGDNNKQCISSEPFQINGSNKRALDELFEDNGGNHNKEECSFQEPKKQKWGEQQILPAREEVLNITSTAKASILPPVALNTCATSSASSAIQQKFGLGQQSIAYLADVEARACRPDPKHISPYGCVGYHPSAPNLHSMRILPEPSSETLQYRLQNSRRRIDCLTAERNRYRDALLKYTSIDPKTGRLGIHVQETEMATLRRVCTTQQQRAAKFKVEIEDWRGKYWGLAQTHNSLIRDYQHCLSGVPEHRNAPNEWERRYAQLSQAYNDLLSTCNQSSLQDSQSGHLRPAEKHLEYPARGFALSGSNISYPSPANSSSSPIHISSNPSLPLIHPGLSPSPLEDHDATASSHIQLPAGMNDAPNIPTRSRSMSLKEVTVIDLTTDDPCT
ncbi:hypothetical protein N7448_005981 [Penicillium atrosanguineum]|uniref:Uncharacterized protein n=1 Tax=Penicillium atrosanguineum TaxID=1132637 RepID=A0A9W9PQS5_9EURO|nr:Alpha N-terminal protein methyltransferase 1 [Penicillium atrosanguineum]KAJ5131823.1 hypothetical protein N7448_005981 [Penicillium atrosanguineum]KAJ5137971.1 hypothetical protein N7526_004204 [Penicillium atrosanguineum]KAJ5289491.1 Alpha N-terminal protein methyltransferase 1 [Penicillium atrosanguineum]KAJ5307306.1 hypothetical protein N7476_007962 [Penicillium atrosanguineum]